MLVAYPFFFFTATRDEDKEEGRTRRNVYKTIPTLVELAGRGRCAFGVVDLSIPLTRIPGRHE